MSNGKAGVAIIGCGTVGGATAQILTEDIKYINQRTGLDLTLKYIVDLNFDHARSIGLDPSLYEEDYNKALDDPDVQIVVELVGGLTIAKTIMKRALKAGKHVVTANKALLAHYGPELFGLARESGVSIGFEASCAGGIPIIKALTEGLLANRIEALYGIVNGTCNYILTEMVQKGQSYNDALAGAQKLGLAEADPTLDVNGMDSAHKLTILSSLAFGEQVDLESFRVSGIDTLDLFDVKTGMEMGYNIKLLAIAQKEEGGLALRVAPVFIAADHPLSEISGSFNAVSVYGHAVGHTMYYGRGAGDKPTGSAVVADILGVALGAGPMLFKQLPFWPDQTEKAVLLPEEKVSGRYYLRICTEDKPGAIASIAKTLAENNISITSLRQNEKAMENGSIPVAVTTHETLRGNVEKAVKAINTLKETQNEVVLIEILDEHQESII